MNDWRQEEKKRQKRNTRHERAFIVLCIYAIVYVWIWRIWKYMLTNLYRVFYVMWNTWSRCSLLFLLFALLLSFVFRVFFSSSSSFLLKTEHIRRTRLTFVDGFFFFFLDAQGRQCVHSRDAGSGQKMGQLWWGKRFFCSFFFVHSCWLQHKRGMEVDYFRQLVNKCLKKTQYRIS